MATMPDLTPFFHATPDGSYHLKAGTTSTELGVPRDVKHGRLHWQVTPVRYALGRKRLTVLYYDLMDRPYQRLAPMPKGPKDWASYTDDELAKHASSPGSVVIS